MTGAQRVDFIGQVVHADDLVAEVSENGAGYETNVASANDANVHGPTIISDVAPQTDALSQYAREKRRPRTPFTESGRDRPTYREKSRALHHRSKAGLGPLPDVSPLARAGCAAARSRRARSPPGRSSRRPGGSCRPGTE